MRFTHAVARIGTGVRRPAPGTSWDRKPGTCGAYVVSREVVVRDPEGIVWSFGTYPGAPRRPTRR